MKRPKCENCNLPLITLYYVLSPGVKHPIGYMCRRCNGFIIYKFNKNSPKPREFSKDLFIGLRKIENPIIKKRNESRRE